MNCQHEIRIKDYKVFVFDLDDTLYLHKVESEYREEYTAKIRELLYSLKRRGKIVCLATHNKLPYHYLDKMNIYDVFHEIIYERRNVNPRIHSIYEYTSKRDMIKEIVERTNVLNEDVVFFDDHEYNINEVKSLGIESVYISSKTGIIIDKIVM